ncbi:hypothetical protein GCM10010411_95540 [Actinomadura fulvescens]|uniref:Uncharacterized protein n=1 Tax=Actinomadura fulvescens TaxID=46160 RepID=A0ABN3R2U6_9ACTN
MVFQPPDEGLPPAGAKSGTPKEAPPALSALIPPWASDAHRVMPAGASMASQMARSHAPNPKNTGSPPRKANQALTSSHPQTPRQPIRHPTPTNPKANPQKQGPR